LLLQDFHPTVAIATSTQTRNILAPWCQLHNVALWIPRGLADEFLTNDGWVQFYSGSLSDHLRQLWPGHRAVIFGLAVGAVVRLIAPLLSHKSTDPAVVVVTPQGPSVISMCSGHQGGADSLARLLAHQLGATPIITGAANQLNLPGIDVLGVPFGWQRGSGDWTGVSAAIAQQGSVEVLQDSGSTLWQAHLPIQHPFQFPLIQSELEQSKQSQARVWISFTERKFAQDTDMPKIQWHPRVLWVGIGCERGTPQAVIEHGIQTVFQANHLAIAAIAGVATIDLKADEAGLVALCDDRQWPLRCFSAADLRVIPVPNPSTVVEAEVGTPSVAEAAALLGGSTSRLLVAKQIVRVPDQPGAVTIAVALSEQEYTARHGQLWLVGIGPGQLDQMTPAAKTAIAQADAVIGYSLYVDLIRSLLRPGQIVETFAITQERQRAERAIALAEWGLTVAVVSSGDCGIYGMGGLVLEQLQAGGWDGKTPGVKVFPGITALQSAAARVGTPLMHDFCAISLSDLLTPWEVIERRLVAAAQADFVTALYNPKSQTRTEQLAIAQQIFLQYRHPQTPVAVVQAAYRQNEQVFLTTLEQLLTTPVDMLTTVLIGNSNTQIHEMWMITPRGYLHPS
jgi:cobalt-precorrin 5A hydrolase / precorrin-3B C17-methyltransferase